jgi:hypothetical protein
MSDGLYLTWQNRQFEDVAADPGLVFEVAEMHWDAYGGPKKALVDVAGPERALWDLLEWLRYGVMIRTGISERAWWGYVHQVTVIHGNAQIVANLDSMYNRIKVSYAYIPTGSTEAGDQRDTDWAEDADSIAEYGTKELISSIDGATAAAAEAKRDALLAARKYPQGKFSIGSSGSEEISAVLDLRGWWDTLGWQYASTPAVAGIDNGDFDKGGHADMGHAPWGKWCQVFTTPSGGCTVREITVSVSRRGTPVDNLKIEIYALDGSGNPTGSALVSESVTGADLDAQFIPSGYNIVHVTLTSGVALTGSTQYGLVLSRSGSLDGTKYYMINLEGGSAYAGGNLKLYFTHDSTWYLLTSKGLTVHNMPFIIWTDTKTGAGRQMAAMISTSAEFITDTYFVDAVTREQTSSMDGTKVLLEELIQVMDGAGPNDRRMLGWVDWERRLRFYEEPAAAEIAYYINRRGQIMDGSHQPVGMGELYRVPGRYVELLDVIPDSVDLSRMINPNVQFVEGIKWTRKSGVIPKFRGQLSLEEVINGTTI